MSKKRIQALVALFIAAVPCAAVFYFVERSVYGSITPPADVTASRHNAHLLITGIELTVFACAVAAFFGDHLLRLVRNMIEPRPEEGGEGVIVKSKEILTLCIVAGFSMLAIVITFWLSDRMLNT